jgi:short-subunit dehydrogenase
MAKYLAEDNGFNICIVGRNQEKLEQKCAEIKLINQSIETMYLLADFDCLTKLEDYNQIYFPQLENKDIGIVVLNAGWGSPALFSNLTGQDVERTVNINVLHVVYSIKALLPLLEKRFEAHKQRSAILVTSSGLGSIPFPNMLTYSASKSFASFLAEGLNYELKDRGIDVISYQAGMVKTKLLGDEMSKSGGC